MPVIKRDVCQCSRCGHVWLPREEGKLPIACAKCKSPYWNVPKSQSK